MYGIGDRGVDKQQDCNLLRMYDQSVAFKRKFDTCDSDEDIPMHVRKLSFHILKVKNIFFLRILGRNHVYTLDPNKHLNR